MGNISLEVSSAQLVPVPPSFPNAIHRHWMHVPGQSKWPQSDHRFGLMLQKQMLIGVTVRKVVFPQARTAHLPKADLSTFWFSWFGFPFLVQVPKGYHFVFLGF